MDINNYRKIVEMNDLPTLNSDFPGQDFVIKSNVPIKINIFSRLDA